MKKILIVEDNDALRTYLKRALERAGYQVLESINGEAGLNILSMYKDISLILLDIMMPQMNGIEFLENVSELKKNSEFKICMTTAKEQMKDIRECLFKGADDYLVKPIDKDLLLEKVNILIHGISENKFAILKMELAGKILRESSNLDIEIEGMSESEVIFYVDLELPVGAKIQMESEFVENITGELGPTLFRVYKTERDLKRFKIWATFIGLKEEAYKKIRSVTTKGEYLDG